MILVIPTQQGASAYSQRMTLDGVSYTLDFAWNGREGAWYVSILDAVGAPLLLSRKLATGSPLLKHYRFIEGLPAGELVAADYSNSIPYAGYSELGPGRGVKLLYFEAATLAEMAAG